MKEHLRPVLVIFIALTIITGIVYPALVTVIAQLVFPQQANGSVIESDGQVLGSDLIGQSFDDPKYFWSRPSATTPSYNAASSSGSNLGPTNPDQLKSVKERVATVQKGGPDQTAPVPIDLVTASASGLDPHISPAAAEYQVTRVSKARGMSVEQVRKLVTKNLEDRTFAVLGEPRVNVLRLNLELDKAAR
jgi:K+-transporting ATPase ATPase C chain